ncbi:uncharacterized protein LOC133888779 [Phragmites australis]|uniref:uncharacterized protein LOC133888779 n=1 Tax=Phragmites australis TaxID=29695 RepID=UPI002D79242E|nr:uncharacterized protein LOC133888779 [Phragmites australis]
MHGHAVLQRSRHSSPVYFMAQKAPDTPVVCSSSACPTSSGTWESRQLQMHETFPSWSPCAGTLVGAADPAFAAHTWAAPHLPSEHASGHVLNQSVTYTGGAHGTSGYRENFLSLLEARNMTPETFGDVPVACDYLTGLAAAAAASNMAGPGLAAFGLTSIDRYTGASSVSPVKPDIEVSPLVCSGDSVVHGSIGFMPCYDHEVKRDNQQQGFGAPTAAFLQQMVPSSVEIQYGLGYSGIGTERLLESSFAARTLSGGGSFSDYRSAAEIMSSNRHEQDIAPEMASGSSGRGAASVTAKRKSDKRAECDAKKSKQEASQTSPSKPQAPKVKLGEKITALQQIVSPFGKTDTASVLFETIKYIKFLHEQIQLFSEPCMTKSTHKGHIQFGGEDRKEKKGTEHDLRGGGLCLVPVSWAPQVYRDDTLPDCRTPAYRSCLYR